VVFRNKGEIPVDACLKAWRFRHHNHHVFVHYIRLWTSVCINFYVGRTDGRNGLRLYRYLQTMKI
jgi:hypothetical protein